MECTVPRGGRLLSLYRWVIDTVCLNRTVEAPVQFCVDLGVWGLSWFLEAIQEVVCRNLPPCLRNLLFPKLFQASLGLVIVSDSVSTHL